MDMPSIRISIGQQTLTLFDDAGRAVRRYAVSTAGNGAGGFLAAIARRVAVTSFVQKLVPRSR